MISTFTTTNKSFRRCLIFCGIVIAVTIAVTTLHSGASPFGHSSSETSNIGFKSQDKTGMAYDQDTIRSPVRPLGGDNYHSFTTENIMERRFQERKKRVFDHCQRPNYQSMRNGQSKHRFSPFARKRVRWCNIPKVGTTYMYSLERKFFNGILSRNENPSNFKKLVFVREPYSRLVSGYIGKIVTNQPWWKSYGTAIVNKFRPRATDQAKRCGNDVTFPEFLKYFIATQVDHFKPNPHWQPSHKLCNPCKEKYDYIGHLETFKDDLSHVLKSVNVSVDMDFRDEEQTMRGKARSIISQKRKIQLCESMCSALRKVWWSFQARGLLSTDIKFPLSAAQCDTINGTAFANLAWDAHIQSTGDIDKYKQKREAMVKLYLQAPLADRLKVRELLMKDFELYGYDSQPAELFPELSESIG